VVTQPPDRVAGTEEPSRLPGELKVLIARLPRRQREVVALRVLADLSAEETGALLGIAPATVHVHLHRALAALRLWLSGEQVQMREVR
jgi:RNA polymerase sigma-70 factor (ECF subfamily)